MSADERINCSATSRLRTLVARISSCISVVIDKSVTDFVHACQSCQRRVCQLAKWMPVQKSTPWIGSLSPGCLRGLTSHPMPLQVAHRNFQEAFVGSELSYSCERTLEVRQPVFQFF